MVDLSTDEQCDLVCDYFIRKLPAPVLSQKYKQPWQNIIKLITYVKLVDKYYSSLPSNRTRKKRLEKEESKTIKRSIQEEMQGNLTLSRMKEIIIEKWSRYSSLFLPTVSKILKENLHLSYKRWTTIPKRASGTERENNFMRYVLMQTRITEGLLLWSSLTSSL